jgi:hypothetical protein
VADTTTNLSVALSDFQTALASRNGTSPAVAKHIELVGGILADAASLFTEYYTAQQLRQVMAKVHPKLEQARDLIKIDLAEIAVGLRAQQIKYKRTLDDKLTKIRGLNDSQRYDAYVSAAADYTAMNTRITLVESSADGLDAMVTAHKELIESSDDKRAVMAFVTFVKDVADKAKKLQGS